VAVSIAVGVPRPTVWAELERIEDHVEWMRDAAAIRFVGDRRRGVGTTFECDTRVGPIRLTDVMEITDWEPGSRMAVTHRGLVAGSGHFYLEDGPGTATTIRWEERLRFPWWLGRTIGAWVARPVLAALWRGNLRRLRTRVEASAGEVRIPEDPVGGDSDPGQITNKVTSSQRPRPDPVGPGMESVWAYPRPPRLEPVPHRIRVQLGEETIADTTGAFRVLETSHPPNYYLPPDDIQPGVLVRSDRRSFCEWKGTAHYFDVHAGGRVEADAAWGYDHPSAAFTPIAGYVAFYAGRMDACFVDDEQIEPQPGGFYGGWITSDVAGPFKGGPGTESW